MDDTEKNSGRSVTSSFPGRTLTRGMDLEEREREKWGVGGLEKKLGKSITGNLGICRTEIGSHLKRLSKRKADFTADGAAVAGLQTPGARPGSARPQSRTRCCCRPVNTTACP